MITIYNTDKLIEKATIKPWIVVEENNGEIWYECPNCHIVEEFKYKYCPWCGQHTADHYGK